MSACVRVERAAALDKCARRCFLAAGYAVLFLYRRSSLKPYARHFDQLDVLDLLRVTDGEEVRKVAGEEEREGAKRQNNDPPQLSCHHVEGGGMGHVTT